MIGTNGGVGDSTISDIPKIQGDTIATIENGGTISYNGEEISTIDDYWALFPNNYYGNLALCIEYVQWKNPDCKIYLVTPLATHQHGLKFEDNGIRKVKKAMLEIGEYYGVTVIDAQANCGINWHNIYEYTTDGTHLNVNGNQKLGAYIAQQMICN
jgi:lysophospholipase L1-like esterase